MSAWVEGCINGFIFGVLFWAGVVEHRHWKDARNGKSCAVAEFYNHDRAEPPK